MKQIIVKVFNSCNQKLPEYETSGASGMDLRASQAVVIPPGITMLVPTGIYCEIPEGYEFQIRPRSGISLKTKMRITNAPGTIDSDFRGQIQVIVENQGEFDVFISEGDKIAQMILCPVVKCLWDVQDDLSCLLDTSRGEGGFGSTSNQK